MAQQCGQASTIPSPIILDLDGDGIETTAQTAGAYFDHAADGFAERTGWARKDDGLLVRDLNNNGLIDSGLELFGSETKLANGQKAPNGFEALKQLDSNKDGQLNAQDAAFTTLQIWQDTDSDGYSQAQELHTLADLGIQSIATAYTTGATTDPQGNQHQQLGSYTTTAGATRAATDVWFTADPTYSIATEWLDVPDDIAALPDATGYGKVRDLHQAMARDPGGALQQLVTQFTQATNASQREDILTSLIYHWTGVQNIDPASRAARLIYGNVIGDARKLEALEEFMGQEWVGVWCWGTRDPNPHGRAAPVLLKAWDQLKELIGGQLMAQSHLKPMFDCITYTWDDASQSLIGDLSQVAARIETELTTDRTAALIQVADFARALKGMGALNSLDTVAFQQAIAPLGADLSGALNTAWAGLVATQGNDTLNGAGYLRGLDGHDTLTTGSGNDTLDGGAGNDTLTGGLGDDTYLMAHAYGQDTLSDSGGNDTLKLLGISSEEITVTRDAANLYLTLADGTRARINGWFTHPNNRIEQVQFADGQTWTATDLETRLTVAPATNNADVLYGTANADTIQGLGGNDVLSGYLGDDTLDGGTGNDTLEGGQGDDLYLYGTGDGQDTLTDSDGHDTLRFKTGIAPEALTVTRDHHHLTLTLTGSSDKIILQGWFDAPANRIERIEFADGAVWDAAQVETLANTATADADYLVRGIGQDVLTGLSGNDQLHGEAGDDALEGGDGKDTLNGGAGQDTLNGGAGQDTLEGGAGDDDLQGGTGNDESRPAKHLKRPVIPAKAGIQGRRPPFRRMVIQSIGVSGFPLARERRSGSFSMSRRENRRRRQEGGTLQAQQRH